MLPMPALGVDSMPGVGASTAVVAPYPWVPVGKHPPPSPPPGPPPPENVAAASLAAATRAALAKASSQERAPPVSDSSVTCDGSCANPIGSYSAHQQREPGLVLQEDTCMEMASTSLVRTDASVTMSSFLQEQRPQLQPSQGTPPEASPLENAGSTSPKVIVPEHASANCCDKYWGKALDTSAAAASAEPETGLAEKAADSTHGKSKEDREASSDSSSSSLTGESCANKVVSNLQKTWEQYSLPDGGLWWSTADSTSWFVENSSHPWEKYQIPDNDKCYWWNQDTQEFFLLR